MTQLSITAIDNKNLFSNYYLDNQIKNNLEWKKEEHKAVFSEIKKLYDTEKDFLPDLNEKQLEQRFFVPIFKILNYTAEPNAPTEHQEFPDYAFFPDRSSLDDAHKNKGTISFYNNAFAIGEVKRWGIELDRFGRDEKDRKRNPSLQIWIYLHDVSPKWGVLSNGAKWRLYCKDRRRDDYYEIDLPSLLAKDESKNVEEFKYFYYFFRKDAFLPSKEGRTFLDDVLKGSADYAKDIGDDLKDNVYKAMKKIAEGFFQWPENRLDIQNKDAREMVQKNTMILLYRLLFLLYAEGKGLLDLRVPRYESYSFDKLKKMVKEKQDGPMQDRYQTFSMELLSRLKSLFLLINHGSEGRGIPKNEFYVPAYNGGLFDPEKHPELEKWIIGDLFLADAIDLLSRSRINGGGMGFVDYSTLEIRHLGSIYEGLLEYKLRVAEDEMVVSGGEWVNISDYNKDRKQKKVFSDFDEFDKVKRGQIYLATDKGERKATGSYYTPDYIVNYIVKNTVGQVVAEKWKEAEANKKSFVDATLSVKVLDPAMGSGHFLVGSIEVLSEKLLLAVKKDIDNGRFSDESHLTSDWARREVVAHCIYGVDLNELAVELAKVGLWLATISKEKPLSFLDHRLKQGNSLIGAQLIDLPWYPDLKAKTKKRDNALLQKFEDEVHKPYVEKIVNQLKNLSDIDDDTIEHINQKKKLFEKLKENKQYLQIKAIADVYTAVYFGNETTEVNKNPKFAYNDLFWALKGDDKEWAKKTNKPWFKKAMEIAMDKSFFHWELEFPEIFFEGGAPKENPGWDAVVGNPPYVESRDIPDDIWDYLSNNYLSAFKKFDISVPFFEKGITLLKNTNYLGYISTNKFTASDYGLNIRKFILEHSKILQILDVSNIDVFREVSTYPYIIILQRESNESIRNSNTIYYEKYLNEKNFIDGIKLTSSVIQSVFLKSKDFMISLEFDTDSHDILTKISSNSFQVGEYFEIRDGIHTGNIKNKLMLDSQISPKCKRMITAENIDRYNVAWDHKWINYDTSLIDKANGEYASLREEAIFTQKEKLVSVLFGLRPEVGYDDEQLYANNSVKIFYPLNKFDFSLKYILSIVNSTVILFYYKAFFYSIHVRGGYVQYYPKDILKIPIRRISFTTPPARRAALVEEAKALYSTEAPDSGCPAFKCGVMDFVGARLSAAPEESDVVHDLLAHLAERMIEMNKEKNTEIKGFLRWLEGEIGAPVEELANKTALKEYYAHDFEAFTGALVKNKKKLKEGYDPTRREPKDKLRDEYNASVAKLAPLMRRIEATDMLIDHIVYRLYGLTEDEIRIVEESIQ